MAGRRRKLSPPSGLRPVTRWCPEPEVRWLKDQFSANSPYRRRPVSMAGVDPGIRRGGATGDTANFGIRTLVCSGSWLEGARLDVNLSRTYPVLREFCRAG